MEIKKDRLLLFFDTEFTDFVDMSLISIGIVSEHMHEFYAENSEFNKARCCDFVNSEVLPKLKGGVCAMPYNHLKEKLQIWISDLLEDYSTVLLVYDYSGDWDLMNALLNDYPQIGKVKSRKDDFEAGIELFFMHNLTNQHHALFDAKALFNGFKVKYAGKDLEY
ncbi:hypothetical protein [Methylophilus sp. Leaf414]|uniref:hypothetical protein n=1 Tax=Methylophilus sp. Leaf414 TaxID=1736371 RepID=UPI000701189A|nr:hypothetical protein [Methylophilus sp. Leaf414]KQT33273.1 hypothetical protein ASG24_13360 [Methylophilus sp. Leaf414]